MLALASPRGDVSEALLCALREPPHTLATIALPDTADVLGDDDLQLALYCNEIKAGRDTVALCRCDKSRIRPFCDGTRRLIGFRAPSAREDGRQPRPGEARPPSR